MFLLRKITIENHEKYIIEAKFIDDDEQGNEGVFSTLMLSSTLGAPDLSYIRQIK